MGSKASKAKQALAKADPRVAKTIEEARKAVDELCKEKGCAPILIRLSWHDAGSFCKKTQTGGARAVMRFSGAGECIHAANAGLDVARKLLEPLAEKFVGGPAEGKLSTADFWALAGAQAVESAEGPHVEFTAGREDAADVKESVEDGRLPDASQGAEHLRALFGERMGFTDREIVALSGAHTLGRCHKDRSGFDGPWTPEPLKFDNSYFTLLLEKKWIKADSGAGNEQFVAEDAQDGDNKLMMLPTDMALLEDEKFRVVVEEYAKDQAVFFKDFAAAFQKLQELVLTVEK